jgi:hypothetical protein
LPAPARRGRHALSPDFVGLDILQVKRALQNLALMKSFAMATGAVESGGNRALVPVESGDKGVGRTTVCQQRHDFDKLSFGLVQAVERGVPGFAKGFAALLTLVTAAGFGMDDDVALTRLPDNGTMLIRADLLGSVHLCFLGIHAS